MFEAGGNGVRGCRSITLRIRAYGSSTIKRTAGWSRSSMKTRFARRSASVGSTASLDASMTTGTRVSSPRENPRATGRTAIESDGRNSKPPVSSRLREMRRLRRLTGIPRGRKFPTKLRRTSPKRSKRIQRLGLVFKTLRRAIAANFSRGSMPQSVPRRGRSASGNRSNCSRPERSSG